MAVVGPVGSGKSSLLSALLGETEKREGLVAVKVQCVTKTLTLFRRDGRRGRHGEKCPRGI